MLINNRLPFVVTVANLDRLVVSVEPGSAVKTFEGGYFEQYAIEAGSAAEAIDRVIEDRAIAGRPVENGID